MFHSLFLNDTEPKIWSYYELIKHEKSEFRLTKKEKDIKLEALLCCERIKFDEKFSGITLSVQNEEKKLQNVEAAIENICKLKERFEKEKEFAETPDYKDYEGAIAKMKEKVEEIFFSSIDNSTEGSPWEELNKKLNNSLVGTEERGAEGTETPISPWAKDGADPPPTYPIDEIKRKLRESETLINILKEIKAMRNLAIKLAKKKRSEYEEKTLKEFNVDCKTFRDNLNIVKEMLGKDSQIEKYIGNSVITKSFLNGGMDEKWKKLEDKYKDLDELSTNLGLYIRDDYQIFHSLGEIVEDVKKGKEKRQRKNKGELDKIGVSIQKEQDKKLNVKTEDLERLEGELEIEAEIYEILNGKVTEKKLEYKDKIKAIKRNLENAATLLQ